MCCAVWQLAAFTKHGITVLQLAEHIRLAMYRHTCVCHKYLPKDLVKGLYMLQAHYKQYMILYACCSSIGVMFCCLIRKYCCGSETSVCPATHFCVNASLEPYDLIRSFQAVSVC